MSIYELRDNIPGLVERIRVDSAAIVIPDYIQDAELKRTYSFARVLDTFLEPYFNDADRPSYTDNEKRALIDVIMDDCYNELVVALATVRDDYRNSVANPPARHVNLFEAAGAEELVLANRYTRVISEKLGHKFEKIAMLSAKVFNTKTHLGVPLRGIDVIVFDGARIRYTQLKTKMDTLTGSQVPRSNIELSIHQNSIFAAALNLGTSWTFSNSAQNPNVVERLAGANFWSIINLDYDYILAKSVELIQRIEAHLYPQQ